MDATPEATAGVGSETAASVGGMSDKECVDRIKKALNHHTVKFLREHMERAGCPVWPRLLWPSICAQQGMNGSYVTKKGIRAYHLSGGCHYKREILHGHYKLRGHEQDCVKKRAFDSVRRNRYCSDAAAKAAVEAVWDVCYNDTYPLERAP